MTDLEKAKIREHANSTDAMLKRCADKSDGPLALFRTRDVRALLDECDALRAEVSRLEAEVDRLNARIGELT